MGTTSWYNIFLLPKLRTGNDRTIGLLPWYLFKSLFNDIRYNGPHFKTKSLWNDMIQVSYMDTCRCQIFIKDTKWSPSFFQILHVYVIKFHFYFSFFSIKNGFYYLFFMTVKVQFCYFNKYLSNFKLIFYHEFTMKRLIWEH